MGKRKHKEAATIQEEQEAERAKHMLEEQQRQRKEKRDVALALLLAIAGLVLTLFLKVELAGIAAFGGLLCVASLVGNTERLAHASKRKIRAIQAAIIVGGSGGVAALLYPYWIEEQAAAFEGDLIGARDGLLPNGAPPWVQIGDSKSVLIMTPNGAAKGEPYFKPFPDAQFLIESGKKAPLISTTVRDRFGNLVVEISRNHWTVYAPYCLDKNRNDRAFEAKDSSGHVLLQVQIVGGPPRVQVQGEWWSTESRGIRIVKTENGEQGEVIPLGPQMQHNDALIEPMFEYPSKKHLWEYHRAPTLELPKSH